MMIYKKSSGVTNLSSVWILPLDCAAISHDFIMMSQYVPVQLVTHIHWNWFPSCTHDPPFLHGFFGLHQSTNFSHRSPEKPDEQWHLYEPSRSTHVASFRHGLESQRLSCSWQLVPLYPERQRHWNEFMSSMHVPPCRQELETRVPTSLINWWGIIYIKLKTIKSDKWNWQFDLIRIKNN